MLIDTHAHIFSEYYENIEQVINLCQEQNVKYIVNAGVNQTTNEECLKIANQFDCVYAVMGIHPEYAEDYTLEDLKFIENHLAHQKVLGIGEIGLDYHYENYNKEKQIELFNLQLALAEKYNVPVVIHSRESTEDTINILKKYHVKGIIHSFSGSKEVANIYIKMGFKLGINGVITFKNAKLKDVVKEIRIEHFVLETDSPYLTPVPKRGQQNFPYYLTYVISFLEELLDIPQEALLKTINANVDTVFDKLT